MRAALWLWAGLLQAGMASAHEPGNHDGHPGHHEQVVGSAGVLLGLCRREAEAHYVGKGEQIYQWTGSYRDYANTLYASGKLRVSGRDVSVECRIARGARERYLTMDLADPAK